MQFLPLYFSLKDHNGRRVRANRGQNGVGIQMERLSNVIQKKAQPKRSRSTLDDIPEEIEENAMAPPKPTNRVRKVS